MDEMHAISLLFTLFNTLPSHLDACQLYALEGMRNLCFVDPADSTLLPTSLIPNLWDALFQSKQVYPHVPLLGWICSRD